MHTVQTQLRRNLISIFTVCYYESNNQMSTSVRQHAEHGFCYSTVGGQKSHIQNRCIPCCFCHPGHNIPRRFCRRGRNIPCHFCHPGQNIPHSDCSFRVGLIWDLHLLLHVLPVNALVRLSKWYKLDLKLIERQFHSVNKFNKR